MTDDTEERLRAALHAYAEQVDDTGAELPLPAGPEHGGPFRRWRGAALVAAAVVAVIGGAWWIGAGSPGGDVVAGSSVGETSPEAGVEGAASPPGSADGGAALSSPEPYASVAVPAPGLPAAPEVGVPYALDLLTHCGVFGTDVDGTWFAVEPPLVEGAGNPPAGWGNPYQPGTLTLTSADEAVFTDDVGHELVLRAAPDSARPGPCD
jgi:hypothetical protein